MNVSESAVQEALDKLARERDKARAERDKARAEVEKLIECQGRQHAELSKLGWSMTDFCEGNRDDLYEMSDRPASLDYGISHIVFEVQDLRDKVKRIREVLKEDLEDE
jgi:phage host-nuclease inhibitor protein Gam